MSRFFGAVDLSVIIVTWNPGPFLRGCLTSLRTAAPGLAAETLVVDNASTDGSLSVLAEFPEVRLVRNARNCGFARAANRGLRFAQGEAALLLNPDTVLLGDAAAALMSFLRRTPRAGVVGPRILNPDGSFYRPAMRAIPTPGTAFARLFGLGWLIGRLSSLPPYNLTALDPALPHRVGAVSGSCLLMRRECWREIGLLDEAFFLYGEDLDLCHRAARAGWEVHYCPDARVLHYQGRSSRKRRMRSTLDFHRAMGHFYRKHYAPSHGPWFGAAVRGAIACRTLGALALAALFPWRKVG